MSAPGHGIAGRLAGMFLRSKLTPLLAAASLLVGALAAWRLPREEEPQIDVPMFDVFVPFPGAGSREVEERVVRVGERKLWEIPGVEYIYSTASPGGALFIVRFEVGTDPALAMTRVYTKTFANQDLLPPGVGQPLVKPRSIDDVPILALTLSGLEPLALRRAAARLREEIASIPDVSDTELIGGRRRRFSVELDPARLSARRLSPMEVLGIVRAANRRLGAGHVAAGGTKTLVETDAFIRTAAELGSVVVGVSAGEPIRLSDVARVSDGPDDDELDVWTAARDADWERRPAATLAVSKRRGANATLVAREALERVERLRPSLEPALRVALTRDYGRTAKEKSDELLYHMLLATLSVTALIALALGWREAAVVLIAIPVTLALTLGVYYALGYTLNRITLFALIFSIGILVDDAIVVVENIHRHFSGRKGGTVWDVALAAVAEVGNPTVLATWTVIAAILPMAFVGGLMGPYMRPIPVGASWAMLFSLAVAFIVSPWAFARLLERWPTRECPVERESRLDRLYRSAMGRLLEPGRARTLYFAGMAALLAGALGLLGAGAVVVKMLPFDDKDEFELILDMPESSALERTQAAAVELASALRQVPEVERVTAYVGTAAPYNFNGLVRHYFLRRSSHQAQLVATLAPRHSRRRRSHDIAKEVRPGLAPIARRFGARLQVAEVPPGPPVLSTLVFELYAPDAATRESLAADVRALLESSDGIVDVATYTPDPEPLERLIVDRERATLNGIAPELVAANVAVAIDGATADLAHVAGELEPVEIRLRLPEALRRTTAPARSLRLLSRNGSPISLGELTRTERLAQDLPVHHKNLRPVSYVIADVAGARESPVYAMLALGPRIDELVRRRGTVLTQYFTRQPESSLETALKWDGEWHITYEVFRDLGLAFALVLVLIFVLVVAWFESFSIPLVIMAPIPLTLVGILPAHWALGAFFTATSMIGFIAGAGIVVRNSIILVDFIELRLKEGMPLREAVIDAGAVRFRPMLLTAAAVSVGAGVMLFDPIFQGLAVSLIAGEVASTLLSRTAVPVLYYLVRRRQS
ncbi:MAG: efflux RND transporter permease subunit [Elusimicrobia bacterium]|nr:efflux RND transporter permease subunit [Elusimicrobiota bacterium]